MIPPPSKRLSSCIRERRLEDMVVQLCQELGLPCVLPPRPKEYSIAPNDAICEYLDALTVENHDDKALWEAKHEELTKSVERLGSSSLSRPAAPPPLPEPLRTRHQGCQVELDGEDEEKEGRGSCKARYRELQHENAELREKLAARDGDVDAEGLLRIAAAEKELHEYEVCWAGSCQGHTPARL